MSMMTTDKAPEVTYLTRKEAAVRYSVSLRQIDSMLANGVLPKISLGRRCIRIPIRAADEVINSHITGGHQR
jgi:hypothetical protein